MKKAFLAVLILGSTLLLTSCPIYHYREILSEKDARITATEAFRYEADLSLEQDVWVNVGGLDIRLDGYDNATRIGYFYESDFDKATENTLSEDDQQIIFDARNSGTIFIIYSDIITGVGFSEEGAKGEASAFFYYQIKTYLSALREDGYLP